MSDFSQNRRRILSLWLPRLPIDRIKRARQSHGGVQANGLSASSWPGKSAKRVFAQMSRPSTALQAERKQDVDARHKAGHDESLDLPSIVVIKENNALKIYSLDEAAARYGL